MHAILASKLFDVPTDQIVVGNGAAELIDVLSRRVKGELAVFGPTFEEYPERFHKLETKMLSSKNFQYTSSEIIGISEGKKGVVIVNPDNPSGNYISRKNLLKVVNKLNDDGKFIILDESFIDFADDGFEASFLNRDDLKNFPNLIVIKSIGKSYGVGGLRIGVLASSNESLIQFVKKDLPVWNINSVGEFFLQIIGKYKSEYREACLKLIEARKYLFSQLSIIPFLEPIESQANYIMCKVSGRRATDLTKDLYNNHGILIKDCSHKLAVDGDFVRIAVRDLNDNKYLIDCLETLA